MGIRARFTKYNFSVMSYQRFTSAPDQEAQPQKRLSDIPTYTIEDAIEHIPVGRFHYKMAAITGLSWMADSLEVMLISILGPVLLCEWHLYRYQEALLSTILFSGYLIGCPLFGVIADKYGRKASLLLATGWTLYFGVLSAFSPFYVMFLFIRCLAGISLGGTPQSATISSEFVPKNSRGKYLMILAMCWSVGGVLAVILALTVLQPFGWRAWLITCALPSLAFFVIAWFWMPESPRFHVGTGQYKSAIDIIHRIAKENGAEPPVGKLIPEPQIARGRILDVIAPSVRRLTIPMWIIWFSVSFAYFGQILLTTEFVNKGSTCSEEAAADIQTSDCPGYCKPLSKSNFIDLLWTSSAEIPGLLASVILVDLLGRKYTSIFWFTILIVDFILLCFCSTRVFMLLLLVIGRSALAAQFQVTYLLQLEAYPTSIRGLALAVGLTCSRIGAIICPFVSQVLVNVSLYYGMGMYVLASLVGAIASCALPFDTRGRALQMGLEGS